MPNFKSSDKSSLSDLVEVIRSMSCLQSLGIFAMTLRILERSTLVIVFYFFGKFGHAGAKNTNFLIFEKFIFEKITLKMSGILKKKTFFHNDFLSQS